MSPIVVKHYACSHCRTEYRSEPEAIACEATGLPEPRLRVGDVVFAGAGYGWFDGDPRWVSNPDMLFGAKRHRDGRNCFEPCCTYRFYYIVTAIDRMYDNKQDHWRSDHAVRYHVRTLAMSGEQHRVGGWTCDEGHIRLQRVRKVPDYVRATGQALLGQKSDWLL